jgi:translation initiation factor IF-3
LIINFKIAFTNKNQQFNSSNNLSFTYPRNEFITTGEMFVIDEVGEKLGILRKEEALALVHEKGLDLILVSPNTKPPVAKIYSWSKFKYQQEKKKKDNKGKSLEQKEIWFNCFIGKGDLDHKLAKLINFLTKKHPVKITIKAKGRAGYLQEKDLLDKILVIINEHIEEVIDRPKQEGRSLVLIVRPIKNKKLTNIENNNEDETQDTQSNSKKI